MVDDPERWLWLMKGVGPGPDEPDHGDFAACTVGGVAASRMDYGEYLRSPGWRDRRQRAIAAAGYRCRLCNVGGDLVVHHRTYERRGFERPDDLTVLCRQCHEMFHVQRPDFCVLGSMVGDVSLERFVVGAIDGNRLGFAKDEAKPVARVVAVGPDRLIRDMREERRKRKLEAAFLVEKAAFDAAEAEYQTACGSRSPRRAAARALKLRCEPVIDGAIALLSPCGVLAHAVPHSSEVLPLALCGRRVAVWSQNVARGVSCLLCVEEQRKRVK